MAEQRNEGKRNSMPQSQPDNDKRVKEKESPVPEIGDDDMAGILQALNGFRK